MGKLRFDCYEEFAKRIEFPVIVIKADTGEVVIMNYEAKLLLGQKTQKITMDLEPIADASRFWLQLHDRKAITEHHLIISNGVREFLIEGLVNEFEVDGELMYMLLFEQRAGFGVDGRLLERIIENSNVIIAQVSFDNQKEIKLNYISRNINRYGYTSEEFYAGKQQFQNLIHPDDIDAVLSNLAERDMDGHDRDSMEYRIVSENRKVSYVRADVYFLRNQFGKIESMELIMIDVTEEKLKKDENQYLRDAIEQSGSVVVVKRFQNEKGTIKYVSANAGDLGIDVEDLRKGRKTFTDYIFLEDRKMMTDILLHAQELSINNNYTNRCRILGEDGIVRWIKFYLSVKDLSENMYEVELLIHDATDEKSYEQNLLENQKALEEKLDYVMSSQEVNPELQLEEFLAKEEMQDFMEAFAANNQLYAVIVNMEGKLLTKPVGPMMRLGEFYDVLEKPKYRDKLNEALSQIDGKKKYYIWEIERGYFERQIAAIPLQVEAGKVAAACLICTLDEEAVARLHNTLESFQEMLEMVVKAGFNNQNMELASRKSRLAEREKSEELEGQMILAKAFAHMGNDVNTTMEEIIQKVGKLLHFTAIAIFCGDSTQESYINRATWGAQETFRQEFPEQSWRLAELCRKNEIVSKGGYLIYGQGDASASLDYFANHHKAKSIMLFGIVVNEEVYGTIIAICREERVFTEREITYCQDVVGIIQGLLSRSQNYRHTRNLNKALLNAYNYVKDCVFIKDYQSGKILFANETMENLFGMDVTGMDSRSFLGTPAPIYTREGPQVVENVKWQSYVQRLNKIMNIQELAMEWENGEDARLVIMREKKS